MASQKLFIDIVARDKATKALGGLRGGLAKLRGAVFNLQNAFIGLGAGLVIRNLVNTGKELENLQVRLKFLLKDTNEGAKAFENMTKFASKVPFSLEEIQSGSGILATVTDNAKDLQNMLEITGNVAAVTGLDFRTAAEQIQRSFSAGIGAADLFREKGVRNMLGFQAGATVSIEQTVEAFNKVFGKGGKFGKSTDELAQTLTGTLSMIGDKVFNFKRVLLDAGFFSQLKKQFGDLNKSLEQNSETMDKIAVTIGTVLAVAVEKLANGFKFLAEHSDKVVTAFKILISYKLAKTFIEIGRALIPIVAGMRALVSLSGAGLALVAASVLAAKLTFDKLGEAIDDVEDKINSNFEAQKKAYDPTMLIPQIHSQKEITKELKKQEKIHFNIFESNRKLVDAVKDSEEKSLNRIIGANRNIFDEQQKIEKSVKGQATVQEEVIEKLRRQNNEFSISSEILGTINSFTTRVSRSIAEAVVLGKSLNMSFKELAQNLLVDVLAKMIERIMLLTIEKLIVEKIFKQDNSRLNTEKNITKEKKKQVILQALLLAMGAGGGGGGGSAIPGGFAQGGAVSKGKPILVGERGAEIFVPNSTGQIVQNARGQGGGGVNVNFTINTIDSRGFSDALQENRGTITGIINNALAEKGRSELV
jgi:hypothetical protein